MGYGQDEPLEEMAELYYFWCNNCRRTFERLGEQHHCAFCGSTDIQLDDEVEQ